MQIVYELVGQVRSARKGTSERHRKGGYVAIGGGRVSKYRKHLLIAEKGFSSLYY